MSLITIVVGGVIFSYSCVLLISKSKLKVASVVSGASTFLTSMGIFGTFLGIAFGLMDFNTENIKESVPTLIEGLKTAFWSSVMGIGSALVIRTRHLFLIKSDDQTQAQGAGIDDIVNKLEQVNRALVGDEESTLLSQMKLARQDTNDKLSGLKNTMEEFVKDMAESNSKVLVEALEEVIRDFNTKINEQFGDNFKQLNEAVGKLLEWQEQYKNQMQEMIVQQEGITQSMTQATKDYQTVVERTGEFAKTANELADLIKLLNAQKDNMYDSTHELAKIIESARTGLPQIETKITELITQIGDGIKKSNDSTTDLIKETSVRMGKITDEIRTQSELIEQEFRTGLPQIETKIAELVTQIGDGIKKSNDGTTDLIKETSIRMGKITDEIHTQSELIEQEFRTRLPQIETKITELVAQIGDGIKKSNDGTTDLVKETSIRMGKITDEIRTQSGLVEQELEESLKTFGQQLAGLSEKFANDYTPLTERLREVVNMTSNHSSNNKDMRGEQ